MSPRARAFSTSMDVPVAVTEGAIEVGDAPAIDLHMSGVRLHVRERRGTREIVREHREWTEVVVALPFDARMHVVATDAVVVVIDAGMRVHVIACAGPAAGTRLPPWVSGELRVTTVERTVVITDGARSLAIPFDAFAKLAVHDSPDIVTYRAQLSSADGDGQMTVVAGDAVEAYGKRSITIQDRAGKRYKVQTFASKPVAVGDVFVIDDPDAAYPLLSGPQVLRIETMRALDSAVRAPTFPPFEAAVTRTVSVAATARAHMRPQIFARLARLRELVVPTLEGEALDDAILASLGRYHMSPPNGAVAASQVLVAHVRAVPQPESRVLIDGDTVARASRGNHDLEAAGDARRWVLVMTNSYEPLALCVTPAEANAIESEGLLLLEPVPAYRPLPANVPAAVAEMITLVGAAPEGIRVEGTKIVMTLDAATRVEAALAYLR